MQVDVQKCFTLPTLMKILHESPRSIRNSFPNGIQVEVYTGPD